MVVTKCDTYGHGSVILIFFGKKKGKKKKHHNGEIRNPVLEIFLATGSG